MLPFPEEGSSIAQQMPLVSAPLERHVVVRHCIPLAS
jgi:hypothetical protein